MSAVKEQMGLSVTVTTYDALLTNLVTRVSMAIARFCNRVAPDGTSALEAPGIDVTEYYDGDGTRHLHLIRYPGISVTSVTSDHARVFGAGTLVAATDYYLDKRQGRIVLLPQAATAFATVGVFSKGAGNVKVVYQGGYAAGAIPADLEEAAILWVSAIFTRRKQLGILSQSIGSYSVTFEQGETNRPPTEVREMLAAFRNHHRAVVTA